MRAFPDAAAFESDYTAQHAREQNECEQEGHTRGEILWIFEVHSPEHFLDMNNDFVLKHFDEVHCMMQSFFEDDLAEKYSVLLDAVHNPL